MQHAHDSEEKKRPQSRGERIFNWLTYGAMNFIGTFAITLPVAYWAKYGGGAKYFEAGTNWLVKKGMNKKFAEPLLTTTALVHGGNLMVAMVKVAEDHKLPIVQAINSQLGEKTDIEALENEPKQTWFSLLKSRAVAWVMVFSSLKVATSAIGEDKFQALESSFAKHVVCDPLGKPTHINGQETKLFRYGKLASLDLFATAAACVLLFVGSRFFATRKEPCPEPEGTATQHHFLPQQDESAETKAVVTKILNTKTPAKDFASAALASRSDTPLQMGA